jgi:Domain of unknown function (DUF1906)
MAMLTFTGGAEHTDSVWDNSDNWEPQQVPVDSDSIIIGNNADWAGPVYDGGTLNLQDLSVGTQGFTCSGVISVVGSFQWTGGFIADGGTIRIQGQGSIIGGSLPESPSLANDSTLDVSGMLTITGPGSLTIGGGQCRILNFGTVTLDRGGLFWNAGAPPLITNNGTITTIGVVTLEGGDVTNLGTVNVPAGSELVLRGNAVLRLAGGKVTGSGTLLAADDGNQSGPGTISVETDTVLPAGLTLTTSGIGQVTTPPPQQAKPPILQIDGMLNLNGGTLDEAHIVISQKGQCTISGTASEVSGGELDNLGTITLVPEALWSLDGGAQVKNSGRLALQGDCSISFVAGFANMTNAGLIESAGTTPNQISSLPISNTGNIVVREGVLNLVSGASLTATSGCVFLYSTTLDSSDGSGSLALTGGTAGGVLCGAGSIGATVTNAGWIEPSGAGLTFSNGFTQQPNGNLLFPATVWTAVAGQPLISIGGVNPSLGGSLWSLADGPAGVQAGLINLTVPGGGAFGRVRIKDDDTRLQLTFPSGGAAGVVTGQMNDAPAFYGLDFRTCPAPNATGRHRMQQLFENTLLSFVCFYLGPVNASWRTYSAAELVSQGWALLSAYFGYQQEQNPLGQTQVNVISADVNAATAQGTTDGNHAVALASGAGAALDQGSIIYLDLETTHVIQPQTFAYIEAWAAAVVNDGRYRPGVYCSAYRPHGAAHPTCDTIKQHDQGQHNLALWPFRLQDRGETWLAQGPLDANGDVTPMAFAQPPGSTGTWAFTSYANAWQFCQDWLTAGHVIYTDTGDQLQLSTIHNAFDFDIGQTSDPGNTVGGNRKALRRRTVSSLSANPGSITSGSMATLTVEIDGPAAGPDGLLVLIRSSLPEVVVPTSVRVPAGQSETSVQLSGYISTGQVTATLSARALNQLTGTSVTTQVTVTPPA